MVLKTLWKTLNANLLCPKATSPYESYKSSPTSPLFISGALKTFWRDDFPRQDFAALNRLEAALIEASRGDSWRMRDILVPSLRVLLIAFDFGDVKLMSRIPESESCPVSFQIWLSHGTDLFFVFFPFLSDLYRPMATWRQETKRK